MKGLLRIGAPTLWLLAFAATPVGAIDVSVGGQKVTIPSPQGFVEPSVISKSTRELAQSFTRATSRLLAVYVSEADAGRLMKGESPFLRRYMFVGVDRELERVDITRSDFKQFRLLIRKQHETPLDQRELDQLMSELADSLSKQGHGGVSVKMGKNLPLGIFSEGEGHISMGTLAKYQVAAAGVSLEHLVAGCTNLLNPANRVLYATVYTDYGGTADLEWAKDVSRVWTRDILAANPQSRARSFKLGGIDWLRVLEKGLRGALIGGILGGIWGVLRWRKKKQSQYIDV